MRIRHLLTALLLVTSAAHGQPRWYRGDTHVHTRESDGNRPPEEVARWYRDHGYDFLVVGGQEVTQQVADPRPTGPRQAHVGSIGPRGVVLPLGERGIARGTTVAATYARNLGRGGRTLAERPAAPGREVRYAARGDEGYVRAVVTDSDGRRAWAQPVWVGRPPRR